MEDIDDVIKSIINIDDTMERVILFSELITHLNFMKQAVAFHPNPSENLTAINKAITNNARKYIDKQILNVKRAMAPDIKL